MHRSTAIAFLGICFVVGGIVRAEAGSASSAMKIGYVDLQKTLNETKAGKKARNRLEKDKVRKQKELDKKQKELQAFAAELDKQRVVLKPDVLRQRERELQEKYVKLQETYLKLQQDLAQQEALLVQEIFGQAAPVIKQIAKQKGFSIIVEKNEGAVLWGAESLDITADVNARIK